MKLNTIKVGITGISGYIQHNGRLADESDLLTVARKEAQQMYKKNPTSENWEHFKKAMMLGGVYHSKELGVYVPEDCLRAMLVKAGASIKSSGMKTYKSAASTLTFENYGFSIESEAGNTRNIDKFITNERFQFEKVVTIGKSKVRSVRPYLPKGWKAEIVISFLPTVIEGSTIAEIFRVAGLEVGIGDWRPSAPKPGPFGRFLVTSIDGEEVE
jgi:hypothetical protein